jgi:hypothetical protein
MLKLPLTMALMLVAPLVQAADVTAKTDPLLAKVLAEAASYENRAQAAHIRWQVRGQKEPIDRQVRFEPTRAAGERWIYLSRNGKPPEPDKLKKFKEQMRDAKPDGYGMMVDWLRTASWRPGVGNEMFVSYMMVPGPATMFKMENKNVAKDIRLDIVIAKGDRPYVSAVTVTAPKPFSPRFGGTVKVLKIEYIFDRLADGEIVPIRSSSFADVSIPFGKMKFDEVQTYSEVGKRVAFASSAQ